MSVKSCAAAGSASGTVATAETAARTSQNDRAFVFNRGFSGDMGFFADNRETHDDVSRPLISATAAAAVPCGQTVGGDSTVVNGGYRWDTPDAGGQFVSFTKFWPVDAWGRWGYELVCQRQTACHDTTQAFAADPAKFDQLEPITHKTAFLVPAGQVALVHLTLNRLGGQLITEDNGELSGVIKAHTLPSATTRSAVSGEREFTVYYVRCAVWGKPLTASESLEHTFPRSNLGKLYRARGLDPQACSAF